MLLFDGRDVLVLEADAARRGPAFHQAEELLLPGEEVDAVYELRREGRVGLSGFLAITSRRVLVYDRFLERGESPGTRAFEPSQIVAIPRDPRPGDQPGDRDHFSALTLAAPGWRETFVLFGRDSASAVERRIREHRQLPPPKTHAR